MSAVTYQNPTITRVQQTKILLMQPTIRWCVATARYWCGTSRVFTLCGKCRPESEGRVDGVGDCLPRSNEFEKWDESEDRAVHAVLFCYFVMMI